MLSIILQTINSRISKVEFQEIKQIMDWTRFWEILLKSNSDQNGSVNMRKWAKIKKLGNGKEESFSE